MSNTPVDVRERHAAVCERVPEFRLDGGRGDARVHERRRRTGVVAPEEVDAVLPLEGGVRQLDLVHDAG
ncbi:hypothetical protein [Halobacterium bonnevillei]|uniref:hypothetical protein n=1 Tax=Halobacterium bonnevillei TaxID=2692200 RepID=UPI001F2815ED|nr:hypothetical protein [Halobacterium bonnevillei]